MRIIKLDIVELIREVSYSCRYTIGFYSSYEVAEEVMNTFVETDKEFFFLTEAILLDEIKTKDEVFNDTTTLRQYRLIDGEIVMTHETPYNFKGYHDTDDFKYKVGDIIECAGHSTDIEVGIVAATPIKYNREIECAVEIYDDSYIVYGLGEGDTHSHIMTVNILGLANVDNETMEMYQEKLKEMKETW